MTERAAVVDVDAGGIRDAAAACPGVVRIGGGGISVATYLPGGRVEGVRVTDDAVEIDVVAAWGPALPTIAAAVRDAVAALVGQRAVDVTITDVDLETIHLDEPLALETAPAPVPIAPPDIAGALPPGPGTGDQPAQP